MAKRDWKNCKKPKKIFSWDLFFLALGLTVFGLVMIYNASVVEAFETFSDKYHYLKNQAVWGVIGIILMLLVSAVDIKWIVKATAPLFFINVFLLVLVLIPGVGTSIQGASRWLDLGFFLLQPSELIKLTFSLYLASWFQKKRTLTQFLFLIGLISLLIILEPDLGTLVVIISSAFFVYYISGVSLSKLIPVIVVSFLIGLVLIISSDYRKKRLLTFLDPAQDPLGSSYHIRQVLIALGSGGLFGIGLGQSRQKYQYLPEVTTDSIFAVIGEEMGFAGATVVLLIYAVFILKGLLISKNVSNKFCKLTALGISTWMGVQILINLGAMVALVPFTGLPLPFVSYGGSSLIVVLLSVGVLLNISKYAG